MATKIKIGHAGSTSSGVLVVNEYNITSLRATVVLRPKSSLLAEKSAAVCEAGCANDRINYSQASRNTLNTEAKKVDYNLSNITTTCYTDCSAFMTLCAIAGGAKVDYGTNAPTCGNIRQCLTQYGDYEALTSSIYLNDANYLKRGDILVRENYFNGSRHTVMVLGNGSAVPITPTNNLVDILKISVDVDTLTTTKATFLSKMIKIENGIEKAIDSISDLNMYDWTYHLWTLSNSGKKKSSEKLKVSSATTKFIIEKLKPGTSYLLKVSAVEANGSAEFCSSNIIFMTAPEQETSKNNVSFNNANSFYTIVDNLYLKIKDDFKRVIIHNNK